MQYSACVPVLQDDVDIPHIQKYNKQKILRMLFRTNQRILYTGVWKKYPVGSMFWPKTD